MPAALAEPTVSVASDLLGPLEVNADARYTFPAGLYGFADQHEFALVSAGGEGLWWLQSEEEPSLVFLLADPFRWFPGYEADLPDAEVALLGPAAAGDLAVFVVVTLGAVGGAATANLQAPIVAHAGAQTARQIVVRDVSLSVQTPIVFG